MTPAPGDGQPDQGVADAVDVVIRRLVGYFAPEPVAAAGAEDTLVGDLHFSSLRMVELAFAVEELFDMDATAMAEAPPVGTVGDLRDFLLARIAGGEARTPATGDVDTYLEDY